MNRRSVFRLSSLGCAGVSCCSALILLFSAPRLAVGSEMSTAGGSSSNLSSKVATSIRTVSREKTASIVRIRSLDEHGEVNGTGFYIDPNGTICTLLAIVRGGRSIWVLQDGKEYPASLCAIDPRCGVAFLKVHEVNGGIESLTPHGARSFISPSALTNAPVLTPLLGIGVPREDYPAVSLGMITGSVTHEGEFYFCVPHLLAEITLREGEGGSPILDLSGNLVGMVVHGTSKAGEFRILPSGAIDKLQRDFLRFGKFNPGWVGAVVEEAAVPQDASRTRVAAVEPASPADIAGLRVGDMILSIAGRNIINPDEVLAASFYLSAGERVGVTILRCGEVRKLQLLCSAPPSFSGGLGSAVQTGY